jgi:hypothetical protein
LLLRAGIPTVALSCWSTLGGCKTSVFVCLDCRGACHERIVRSRRWKICSQVSSIFSGCIAVTKVFKYQTSLPLWNELTFRSSFRRNGGIRNIGTSRVRSTAAAHHNPIFAPEARSAFAYSPSNTSSASLSILGEASKPGSNISSIIIFHFPGLTCSSPSSLRPPQRKSRPINQILESHLFEQLHGSQRKSRSCIVEGEGRV